VSANPATFAELVNSADLTAVRVAKLAADSTSAGSLREERPADVNVQDSETWVLNEARTEMTVLVSFEIIATGNDERSRFTASVTYELVYLFREPLADDPKVNDALEGFAKANPRFNAWPFLREFVKNTSTACELTPIVLLLLKPYAKRKDVGTVESHADTKEREELESGRASDDDSRSR
jgi:hypothetical protein